MSSEFTVDSIDWENCRQFFRLRLIKHLGGPEQGPLDDLIQEACVRLLRALRTSPAESLEGLMAVIAGRTWKDYLRRNGTQKKYFEALDDDRSFAAESPEFGDLKHRLELIVQEIFATQGKIECQQLATRYFDEHDWRVIGDELGIGYGAVRKRWSRCLSLVRKIFSTDPRFADLAAME